MLIFYIKSKQYFYLRSFINIEPSAVDEERDTTNASVEGNHENLTLVEQDVISATISTEMQNPDLSTTNTTMSPLLSTKLWSDLNIAKKIVCISFDLKNTNILTFA